MNGHMHNEKNKLPTDSQGCPGWKLGVTPCPICALPSGFHGPACHNYTRPKTTRAPGREAFDAWVANVRTKEKS